MPHASVLVRNLLVLRTDARSGVLTVRGDGGVACRLYLRRGTLVFADDDATRTGAGFAKRLVREGVLTTQQVAQVTQLAQGAPGRNPGLRFGEVAVEIGLLRSDTMRASLSKEARAAVVRMFQRYEVSWELDDTANALAGIVDFPMEIEALWLEAIRWMDDDAKLAYGLGAALDRKVKIEPGTGASIAKRFELSSDEAAFLLKLDGTRTARELSTARDTTVDAHALLTALIATRSVQAEGGGPSGQMKAATPSGAIAGPVARPSSSMAAATRPSGSMAAAPTRPSGSMAAATRPSGSMAAAAVSKNPSVRMSDPPISTRRPSGSMQAAGGSGSMPAARTSDVMRALEAQKRAAARPASEEEKRLAELTTREAVGRAKTRGWASAAQDLQRAVELDPENLDYKVYAKYATIRASNEPPHPVDRTELRRIALVAVKVNPDFAFGYVAAAEMMVDDGEHEPAHRMLTRALKLEPNQADALRLMRIVERRIAERRR